MRARATGRHGSMWKPPGGQNSPSGVTVTRGGLSREGGRSSGPSGITITGRCGDGARLLVGACSPACWGEESLVLPERAPSQEPGDVLGERHVGRQVEV